MTVDHAGRHLYSFRSRHGDVNPPCGRAARRLGLTMCAPLHHQCWSAPDPVDRRTFPLTMDRFAQAFAVQKPQRVTVQIRKRGEVFCGVPVDFSEREERPLMFKVATCIGDVWVTAANTRQCSGVDGFCRCAGESATCGDDAASGERSDTGAAAALQVVPLGNTGKSTFVGGTR